METLDLRPATLADLPLALSLWEPGDDAAQSLEGWLSDATGVVMLALVDGLLAGIAHIRMVGGDESWLDGMRISGDQLDKGIGVTLVRRCRGWAREQGANAVRCALTDDDEIRENIVRAAGFAPIGSFVPFEAPTAGAVPDLHAGSTISQPGPDALDRLWNWLEDSNIAPLTGGLILPAGIGMALTDTRLAEMLAAQAVWIVEEWGGIQSLAIADARSLPSGEEIFSTSYLDGTAESVSRLMLYLRALAAERGFALIDARPPNLLILHDSLNGAGFVAQSATPYTLWAAEA